MATFQDVVDHMLAELKSNKNPSAFVNSTFVANITDEEVVLSSSGDNLSNDFKKNIGDGFILLKYRVNYNGTFTVVFICDPNIDMTRFEMNEHLASLYSAKAVRIDVYDFLNMMKIEISDVNSAFLTEFRNILGAASALVLK